MRSTSVPRCSSPLVLELCGSALSSPSSHRFLFQTTRVRSDSLRSRGCSRRCAFRIFFCVSRLADEGFRQSWGITIGGTILQNSLQRTLPAEFLATLPQGVQLTYSVIPTIPRLAEPLQTQVRAAFAESTKLMWQVMLGLSGAGLLTCLLMREIPMKTQLDDTWALQETDCSPKVVSEDGKAK